jgi:23S rRNA (cytidine1920-2'-O)/16S rRNA (cytidine1409-2'-O)-methyltransferase
MKLPELPDVILIDVSFISLRLVLPAVARLAGPNTSIIAMAKPHFEADYVTASKHKGVIKNNTIRRAILKQVETFMLQQFVIVAKADSQVLGRKGNQERFFYLHKKA